jgi:glycosyltransferase involved in cell wall biosynthesis
VTQTNKENIMNKQFPYELSAIVPIFNEQETVARVVEFLISTSLFVEVICVDDGSTDGSIEGLQHLDGQITVITNQVNRGKGFSLAKGIERATGELVVFIDADLVNLNDQHIESLLQPIREGEADAVLGYPKRGNAPNLTAHLTGQRVYHRKDLLPHLDQIEVPRFGVEVLLNDLFQKRRVKMVPLQDLIGLTKVEKRSFLLAIQEYTQEVREIVRQLVHLRRAELASILQQIVPG